MNSAIGLVILGVCMISYSGPLVKGALLQGASPVTVAFLRMVFAAVLLLPIMLTGRKGKPAPVTALKKLTVKEWAWSLLSAVCLALHYATWMTSLNETSTFASVALVCMQPLFVAALSGLLLHEPMEKKAYPGAAVAIIGAIMVGLSGAGSGLGELRGNLLALTGAALMAGHWLCGRYIRRTVDGLPYNFLIYIQTAILLGLMLPFTGGLCLPGNSVWYVLGLAAGSTLLGHMMFNLALGKVPATVVSFAILGEPVGAMLFSMWMFGEVPTPLLLAGGAVVLAGLVMYTAATVKKENG